MKRRGSDIAFEDQFITACQNGDLSTIEALADAGLRHKTSSPSDYLYHWLRICRLFAFATHDDSWGELEKLFAIIIKRLVEAGIQPG